MGALPMRFLGLVTRHALAEMLAQTYGEVRNIDPNEAHLRLDTALSDVRLIEEIQIATWNALANARPKLDPDQLTELVAKKLARTRTFKALKPPRSAEHGLAALAVAIDGRVGVSSGEALDLLETKQGQALMKSGIKLVGEHLAKSILK
jgi:hypothetical protein